MKLPTFPSTDRLNAAHQEVLTLHAEVSQLQAGFAQEERAHRATVQARRAVALALSDEIDAHLHTIRDLLAAEAAIERVRAALDGADRYDDMDIIRGALNEQPAAGETATSPQKPAYDAVYAYIRALPHDFLPTTIVDRNAIIWRAVNAALDEQPTT